MQQGTFFDEAQRTLGHDDVATLRYAASGIDERESGGPGGRYANDNYSIVLEYGGISTTNCDISMSMTSTTSLAFCLQAVHLYLIKMYQLAMRKLPQQILNLARVITGFSIQPILHRF